MQPILSETWVYGRGSWCPGQEVPVLTYGGTDMLTMGSENEVGYLGHGIHGGAQRARYSSIENLYRGAGEAKGSGH